MEEKEETRGRPQKYGEKVATVCFRVPTSKVEDTKGLVKDYLDKFKVLTGEKDDKPVFSSGKRVIFVGKGGSGKDFAISHFEGLGYKRNISYTTRLPRTGEENGKHYWFLSEKNFKRREGQKFFYEVDNFNGWFYGTSLAKWKKCQLFIMTPAGIAKIPREELSSCLVVFLDINQTIREERLLRRSDADSVERRLAADDEDFKNFTKFDLVITDPLFDPRELEKTFENFLSK